MREFRPPVLGVSLRSPRCKFKAREKLFFFFFQPRLVVNSEAFLFADEPESEMFPRRNELGRGETRPQQNSS